MKPTHRRKLATIFAADVAGYSRLMSEHEEATLRTLAAYREILDGLIGRHGGRIANTAGDSVLAEFESPVEAVRCALAVQQAVEARNRPLPAARRMRLRIGINVGDVALVEGGDLLGDGVNLAARIEALAPPGGICISGFAYDQVEGKLDLEVTPLGTRQVKNIGRPVRVYRVTVPAGPAVPPEAGPAPILPPAGRPRRRGAGGPARGPMPGLVVALLLTLLLALAGTGALVGLGDPGDLATALRALWSEPAPPAHGIEEADAPPIPAEADPPPPGAAAPQTAALPAPDLEALRSRVAVIASSIGCADLTVTADAAGPVVTGFVPAAYDATLRDLVGRVPGLEAARLDVTPIADGLPLCEAMRVLRRHAVPVGGPGLATRDGRRALGEGEPLALRASAPADGYLWVAGLDPAGGVRHLLADAAVPAGATIDIGGAGEFPVAAPFGPTLILAVWTPRPLFAAPRPPEENAAAWLPALAEALDRQASDGTTPLPAGSVLLLTTQGTGERAADIDEILLDLDGN